MIHLVLDFFGPLAPALDNSARTPAAVIFDAPRSAASHALLPKRIVVTNYWPERETSRNNTLLNHKIQRQRVGKKSS
jgi:hypothetical protein